MTVNYAISCIEDGGSTAGVASVVETQANQTQSDKSVVIHNPDMLQHLVTEAVKKVLADQEVADTDKVSQNIVSQVVEGLKPTLASSSAVSMRNTVRNVIGKHIAIPTPIIKPVTCVYNPTPISELKKRHIPVVSYMPTRESRVAIKRKTSPERVKPWLNIIQESGNSQSTEITYKPTAIVNATNQDTVQSYVPTIKPDSPSSNSYDDSNSNDYQTKFKEEYYPRLKKKREEYVPKSIKAPLKTTQELDKTALEQLESEFDMIDEIYTSSHSSNTLRQSKTLHSEDSQDYPLDIEPKFSDDESIEDISKDKTSVKEAENTDEKKKNARIGAVDKETSNKVNKVCKNYHETKIDNIESSDKSKQRKADDANKSLEKKKDNIKENASKERYRSSHNKSKERDRKDRHNSESKDKEKSRHKSDSGDRHHSSSSKDKDRRKNSHYSKNSSHKSREHSDSRKSKNDSSKKDRNDHCKSSRHESKSKSNTKSSKHTSSTKRDHHSESNRRSSYSSRKSVKHKESERNCSSDRSSVPDSVHSFVDNEIFELSDSDHDVQEECLRIFQVNNIN